MYFILLLLGAAATVTVVSMISSTALQTREQAGHAKILAESRQALIGWAITRGSSTTSDTGNDRPGDLPAPDVADTAESTPNYDGDPETLCMDGSRPTGLPLTSNSVNVRCLGRLPWLTLKMALQSPSEQDAEGKMPWYAVSANLSRIDSCMSMLNPETVNRPYTGFSCASSTNLPYPWLTVRDTRGNVLSNRVAFVVLLPGRVVSDQIRPASPSLGGASQYLDSMTVLSGCASPCVPGTYSNADFDNDFIAGDASDTFNDKLVYVTIDELMAAAENQVASAVADALKTAATSTYTESAPTPRYFWLAPFNPAGTAYQAAAIGTARGMLPGHSTGSSVSTGFSWSITDSAPVYVSGSTVTEAEVRNYSAPAGTGSCVWTTSLTVTTENLLRTVQCSAVQYYPKDGVTIRLISLSYTGSSSTPVVSTNPAAANLVIVPATTASPITRSVTRTTLSSVSMYIVDYYYNPLDSLYYFVGYGTENASSGYSIRTWGINYYPTLMRNWYYNNEWHRFTYAAIASPYQPGGSNSCSSNCFTVRLNDSTVVSNAPGVVLNAGQVLSGQNRSPHNTTLSNYFESNNNSSTTLVFDRKNPLSSTFNDHAVAITP